MNLKMIPKSEVVHETKFNLSISYSANVRLAQLDKRQICVILEKLEWIWPSETMLLFI